MPSLLISPPLNSIQLIKLSMETRQNYVSELNDNMNSQVYSALKLMMNIFLLNNSKHTVNDLASLPCNVIWPFSLFI